MSRRNWKQIERDAASLFNCTRYPANMGHRLDFESPTFVGQVKNPRVYSLHRLEQVAQEMADIGPTKIDKETGKNKIGVVVIKRSGGAGRRTPKLVVLTEGEWRRLVERYGIQ